MLIDRRIAVAELAPILAALADEADRTIVFGAFARTIPYVGGPVELWTMCPLAELAPGAADIPGETLWGDVVADPARVTPLP